MAKDDREATQEFEMVIVGAGFAGLHMLYRALKSKRSVRLYEAGSGVGGTWYWNRYPGARVDLESLEYSYAFSEEVEQEWQWSERYAAQPELERYTNYVTDKFGMRPHIQFDSRIVSAVFDEDTHRWELLTSQGETVRARFCVMATGLLSAPTRPNIIGADSFRGAQVQTGLWPKDGPELKGRRVCVIGTGSSAIQCIPEIAKVAAHLTVFQRTAAYCIPAHNAPMDPEYERRIKSNYAELRSKEHEALAGFVSLAFIERPNPVCGALDVSDRERQQEYDRRWAAGGLCFYLAYNDLLFNPQSNETLAKYVQDKIREKVRDPALAEKLVPKGYPILTKRLCADHGYYETYNRDNVTLVDLQETPIERIAPDGVWAGGQLHACDVIVWATGFDAMTGALDRIDIRGRGGRTIRQHWADGLRTYLGMMCAGFPNMITINGPGSPSALFSPILLAEYQADWIERCLDHLNANGLDCIEPIAKLEDDWVAHSDEAASATLFPSSKNWYMGDNIPGKPRRFLIYIGGFPSFRDACEDAASNGYRKFRLSAAREAAAA